MKCCLKAAVLLALLRLPFAASAQNGRPGQNTDQTELREAPIRGNLPITLQYAIELALERNPTLKIEKIHLEQARAKIEEEKGNFNWVFNARATTARRENIVASRFFPTGLYVDTESSPGIGIEGKTSTGGHITVGFDYKRLISTSNTQTLSPQYTTNFVLGFSHSLWRDFGGINKTPIRVAQKGAAIAEGTLAQRVSQLIQQIEESYWNLSLVQEDLQQKHRSLEVASGLLRRNEELQTAGLVAQVSVLEARAGVATREDEVITSESEAAKAEDRLKVLLWIEPSSAHLVLLDRPPEGPDTFDALKSLSIATQHRPEIQALQREIEQRELEVKFAANQTKPRLDLNTQFGVAGLSGKPNSTCVDPTAILCQPVGSTVGGSIFAGQTNPADAFDQLFSRHPYDNWTVEVKLQVPLGNRTAEAQRTEADLKRLESTTRLRALYTQIESEIRDAIREAQTSRRRIDAAQATIDFLAGQLDGSRRKFEAGLSSSYDVLQVLGEMDKARTAQLKARMDFNVGQSKLRLAEASLLEKYNVELKRTPRYSFDPQE